MRPPPAQQNQIHQIERVQMHAARFVTNNSHTSIGCNSREESRLFGLAPLENHRARIKVTIFCEAINGLDNLLSPSNSY